MSFATYRMYKVHALQDLPHEQLGNRMRNLEIWIPQQSTHVVVHVGENHKHLAAIRPVRRVFSSVSLGHEADKGEPTHSSRPPYL